MWRERERVLLGTTVHNGGSRAAPVARTPHCSVVFSSLPLSASSRHSCRVPCSVVVNIRHEHIFLPFSLSNPSSFSPVSVQSPASPHVLWTRVATDIWYLRTFIPDHSHRLLLILWLDVIKILYSGHCFLASAVTSFILSFLTLQSCSKRTAGWCL